MRELWPRTLTATALIATVFGLLIVSKASHTPWGVMVLAGGVTLICSIEYVYLVNRMGIRLEGVSLSALNVLYVIAPNPLVHPYTAVALGLALVWPAVWYPLRRAPWSHVVYAWFGVLYIPALLRFTYPVYEAPEGVLYLALLLISVWGYDIAAYLVGSRWGRVKLTPRLSPGKTWEGVLGGTLGVLGLMALAPWWVPSARWAWPWWGLGLLLSAATQVGDLFESWLKRRAGVKDAGAILPGHGGLLDRVDGLLFAVPVYYLYLQWVLRLL